MVTTTLRLLSIFGSSVSVPSDTVRALLAEAHTVASETFGAQAAQAWAQGFSFPPSAHTHDAEQLALHHGDFVSFVAAKQAIRATERLSPERVHASFTGLHPAPSELDPVDIRRLLTLASEGISIPVPASFRRCTSPPPLRAKYRQVASAVDRLIYDQHRDGTVVLLPLSQALSIPGIHFSSQHWTTKKGKPQGRLICDVANADSADTSPLNGDPGSTRDAHKAALESEWGTIHHPTLTALMRMVLSMAARHGWDDLLLWKKDLQGAFNLLWIHPAHCARLAFLLSASLVVIHISGMFGWTGMPYVFDVVTRCLRYLVRLAITGASDMYVDDVMGVSTRANAAADMAACDATIRGLLGPHSVAANKDELGRSLDFIGWQVDLDSRRVTISHRNFLRTIHAFFGFDLSAAITLTRVQCLASLASRCSMLARQMRPFTRALHECAAQYSNPIQRRRLSATAKADVCLWRAFLVASHLDPLRVSRPITSFATREPTVRIEYDSSLSAFAVGVSTLHSGQPQLRVFAVAESPFAPTTEARFQNTYEFLAVVLGLLLMRHLGLRSQAYSLHGDSISSLTWAASDRTASALARRANIGFTIVATDIDALVSDTVHVPGKLNTVYDGLSRGVDAATLGLDPALQLHLPPTHPFLHYLALCDPVLPLVTPDEHLTLAAAFLQLLP